MWIQLTKKSSQCSPIYWIGVDHSQCSIGFHHPKMGCATFVGDPVTCVESHHRWSIEKIKFKNKRKQSQKHHELNQKCRNSPFDEPFRNRSIVGTIWGWSGFSIPIKLVKHSEGSHVNNKYAGLLSRGWTALKGQHSRVTGAAKLCNWVYPLVN